MKTKKPWEPQKPSPKELIEIEKMLKNLTKKEANNLLKKAQERRNNLQNEIMDAYNRKEITKEEMNQIFKDNYLNGSDELDQIIKDHED